MTEQELPRLKPTGDRVIVWLNPGVQETAGGIIIPPMAQQITQTGRILAVSEDVSEPIAVGQTVMIDLHCGTHLCWKQNTPVLMVETAHVQAILD